MVESESTTGVLLRVSRMTLVTVETAKTDDEAMFMLVALGGGGGGGGEGGAGWPVVGRIVLAGAAAVVAVRKLLTPATANVEVSLDLSKAT